MEGLSWEEKYLRLRDDHTSLTHKANEQDDTIRRMNTKLSQIEKSIKLKYRLDKDGDHGGHGRGGPTRVQAAGVDGGGLGQPRNRENEQLVEELHRYNGVLLRENSDLKTKIKSLTDTVAKKKKELVSARLARTRTVGGGPPGPRSPCPAARMAEMRSRHVQLGKKRSADDMDMEASKPRDDATARKLSELVDKLRGRVSNAETQLKGVRAENQRLRQDKLDAGCAPEDAHEQAMAAAAAARREHPGGRDHDEMETLHRELREAQAKAQLIQARFDHLEARTLAQADLHEGSVDKLQETNRQLRDVRRELQDVLHERDVAVAKSARVDDLEETVSELRRHNKELEDQVTRLCESPFISQAFREQERSERVLELEQGSRAAQLKIDHLQETAQTHHAALVTLKKQTVRLREGKERAERALQEMRVRHNETEAGAQLMADKMRLYAGDEDVDLEELERALTIVRRKMADPESFPGFLENPEDEVMDNIPALRRKLQRVQVSNLNLTRELERAERMLKAQMSINRDLHVELEDACRRSTLDRGELGQKLRDFEALALERLTTVHRLEAQVKQLLYGPARRQRLGAAADASVAALEQEQESALLSELAEGDFSADQNIVEVWVVGAELEPGVLSAGASSFIVVDFFDFESQATPLLPGISPAFDFATTFKVTVDDFFLRYLGTEGLVLELNQARAADFELVGRRQVALAGLLSSKPRIILQREPLISTRDGAVVGYVHIEVRMALPVTELYALFLERRPEEKERVEQARRLDAKAHGYLTCDTSQRGNTSLQGGGVMGDTSRLRNELEVAIVGCRGLPSRGSRGGTGVAPAPYVHYQLLGFQDVFTPVVHGACEPVFRHTTAFPVVTDEKLLRFLARHRLTVTVMDDLANNKTTTSFDADGNSGDAWPSGDACDDESEGLIGEASVDLSPLADGRPVVAKWTTVEDETGRAAGQVSVSARWIQPLRTGGDPGPHGLSAEEVEGLMARFSPEKDGQVNYVAFLQESDPPPAVLAALSQTHAFLSEAAATDGLCATEALGAILGVEGSDPQARVSEETFVSAILSSGRITASPDELAAAYSHAAGGSGGRILTLEHLAAFASTVADGHSLITENAMPHLASDNRDGGDTNNYGGGIASVWVGGAPLPGDGGPAARRALVKVRVKCRDAGLLGRSFPGEAFARLDPEGGGRVSRPAFKQALQEMGFALVDEAPASEIDKGTLRGGNAAHCGGGGGNGGEGVLGRMVAEDGTSERNNEEIRLRKVEGDEEDEARRKAFRDKVEEIEKAVAEKVGAAATFSDLSGQHPSGNHTTQADNVEGEGEEEGVEPRLAKLDDANNAHSGLHHPSSVVARDTDVRGPSTLGRDSAATLLQSRFRGYHLRKGGGIGGRGSNKMVATISRSGGGTSCSVLDLEDFIDAAFERFEGACSLPDMRAAFAKLDRVSTGLLDRQRFALALRGLRPSLELPPPLLYTAMEYFDSDSGGEGVKTSIAGGSRRREVGSGGRIDYRAFTIFCEERQLPQVSPAVTLLKTKTLRPGAMDVLARRDPSGTGFVSRVDLFDGLRELGISGTPPVQLRHLATIFEDAEDMVDYASLVLFASEQPAALKAASAVSRLRHHLLALRNGRGIDLRATLEAFAVGDRGRGRDGGGGGGILRQEQLDAALRELGFTCTEDEKSAMHKRLDPAGAGVSCRDLVGFVEGPEDGDSNRPACAHSVRAAVAFHESREGKLLRRAQATVVEAAQRMDSDFEAFDSPYLRYDWRRTGRVGTAEFIRSTLRCGFPFTRAQAAFLAGVFGDGCDVCYPSFLSWATPGPDGLAASGGRGICHQGMGGGVGLSRVLEKGRDWKQRGEAIGLDRGGDMRDRGKGGRGEGGRGRDTMLGEDEAELKVRTALENMGPGGVSRAWDEFERVDPGGRRGSVREEQLVEVLATLGLPVSARDVADLMNRFSASGRGEGESSFLYPRLLESVAEGGGRPKSGRPEDVLRHIRAELGRLVRRTNDSQMRPAAMRAFESLDRNGTGRVSRRDFRRALSELGFNRLGDEEAADILDYFDPHRDGRIRYQDFLKAIEEDDGSPSRAPRGEYGGGGITERERLGNALGWAINNGIDYRREMELEDGGRAEGRIEEGVVSQKSFRASMKRIRADLSETELRGLERRFSAHLTAKTGFATGRGGEGGVRYVEFLHWGEPNRRAEEGGEEAWAVEERLRQMIRRRFDIWIPGALKKAFRHFDARRKGKVSETDLSDGLRRLGLELTARQDRILFKAMDLDGRGVLVYPDLVVFARDPHHSDVRNKILQQLRRVTTSQAQAELERRDPAASGVVSEQALGKALTRLGADLAGADLGRLMHRFDAHEDGTASIRRVLSFLSDGVDGTKHQCISQERDEDRVTGHSDEYCDILEDARNKLRAAALKLGTSTGQRMSPRRLFEYLDSDGKGELCDTHLHSGLDALGIRLTRREINGLMDTATGTATSTRRAISFRQFSRMLEESHDGSSSDGLGGAGKNVTGGRRSRRNKAEQNQGSPSRNKTVNSRRGKGVTFCEDTDDGVITRLPEALLRVSLRRLLATDSATNPAATAGLVGPPLRDNLRGALQAEADARGARKGGRVVDREMIRRAMVACGAPLNVQLLEDLEGRFDRGGTGEIDIEEFVDFVAGELEEDLWQRVASDMVDMQRGVAHGSKGRGGVVRAFVADLSRSVDGREEVSRRELRKALERHGVSILGEAEVVVLCDSIDPKRRDKLHISSIGDSLNHGKRMALAAASAGGVSSGGEDDSDGRSSAEAAVDAATAALADLRRLVSAAERERGIDLLESFEHFDRRGQGEVSEVEFWEGLQALGLAHDLPRSHASRIVKPFMGRRSGRVRYRDFVKAMGNPLSPRGPASGYGGSRAGGGKKKGRRHRSSPDDIERLVDRLKEEIGRLTYEADGPPPFGHVFEAADHKGLGTLPPLTFRRCLLEGLGFNLTEVECEALLEYLDTGGDNNISYREFLQFVGHEVRQRTPPRSARSPRRARFGSSASRKVYDDHDDANAGGGSNGRGDRENFVRSPPRRRQLHPSPPSRGGGKRF